MGSTDTAVKVMAELEHGWNAGDGHAFAAPFTEDATFVTIRGELHTGSQAIGAGHDHILRTIYSGSTVTYEVVGASDLADGVVVAQARATLTAPTGPLAGTSHALATVVIIGHDDPRIAAFHNTLVA
jgi:uncharacterized protein (TIGR02246 family)